MRPGLPAAINTVWPQTVVQALDDETRGLSLRESGQWVTGTGVSPVDEFPGAYGETEPGPTHIRRGTTDTIKRTELGSLSRSCARSA